MKSLPSHSASSSFPCSSTRKLARRARFRGAALVEYAFLLVSVTLAAAAMFRALGPKMAGSIDRVNNIL